MNKVIIKFVKIDLTCATQVCCENTCFHVSAGRHRLAYVMYKYFNVLEWIRGRGLREAVRGREFTHAYVYFVKDHVGLPNRI